LLYVNLYHTSKHHFINDSEPLPAQYPTGMLGTTSTASCFL